MKAGKQASERIAPFLSRRTGATWLKYTLREPLVHFLMLATLIFVGYRLVGSEVNSKPGTIVVTAPKIEQMATLFTKTWQRPPTSAELKGLIDDQVKEEVLVREALALGLDRDDTVIRRRLRQKMEFLNASATEVLTPTDTELQDYLQSHAVMFEIDPMFAFQQVFFNPQRHGDSTAREAALALQTLRTNPAADRAFLGDPTLLPIELPLSSKAEVGQIFGAEFAAKLDKAPLDQWTGPITGSFGLHLARVSRRIPKRAPLLEEVRDSVAREWTNTRRTASEEEQFAQLLKHYTVNIEFPVNAEAGR